MGVSSKPLSPGAVRPYCSSTTGTIPLSSYLGHTHVAGHTLCTWFLLLWEVPVQPADPGPPCECEHLARAQSLKVQWCESQLCGWVGRCPGQDSHRQGSDPGCTRFVPSGLLIPLGGPQGQHGHELDHVVGCTTFCCRVQRVYPERPEGGCIAFPLGGASTRFTSPWDLISKTLLQTLLEDRIQQGSGPSAWQGMQPISLSVVSFRPGRVVTSQVAQPSMAKRLRELSTTKPWSIFTCPIFTCFVSCPGLVRQSELTELFSGSRWVFGGLNKFLFRSTNPKASHKTVFTSIHPQSRSANTGFSSSWAISRCGFSPLNSANSLLCDTLALSQLLRQLLFPISE